MSEIKACPFCGGEQSIIQSMEWGLFRGGCPRCRIGTDDRPTRKEVVDALNHRAPSPAVARLVEAAKGYLLASESRPTGESVRQAVDRRKHFSSELQAALKAVEEEEKP